jgi:hypothetical protein
MLTSWSKTVTHPRSRFPALSFRRTIRHGLEQFPIVKILELTCGRELTPYSQPFKVVTDSFICSINPLSHTLPTLQSMMSIESVPYGRRLPVTVIDNLAQSEPNRICFSISQNDEDISQGFRDITCKQYANAINHAARWLDMSVNNSKGAPFEVIGYEGPNDLRYAILAVAAVKVEKQVRSVQYLP